MQTLYAKAVTGDVFPLLLVDIVSNCLHTLQTDYSSLYLIPTAPVCLCPPDGVRRWKVVNLKTRLDQKIP